MKTLFIFVAMIGTITAHAQNAQHKIVYDLSSNDTSVHAQVLRQFNNVLQAVPTAQLEVICHGPAVYMLVKSKVYFEDKMKELKGRGNVSFKVCANAMKRLNVDKTELISLAVIVPVAIVEISEKQMEGWTYIKAAY